MPKYKSIQQVIADNGMTVKEFAEKNNFHPSFVSNVINNWFPDGQRKPGVPRGLTAVIAARIEDLIRSHCPLNGNSKKTIDISISPTPGRKSVKEILAERRMTLTGFAKSNGFPPSSVYTVIKNWFPDGQRKPGVPRGLTSVIADRIEELILSHRSLNETETVKKTIDM